MDHKYNHVGIYKQEASNHPDPNRLLVAHLQVPQPSSIPGNHSQPPSRHQPSHHGARLPKHQGHEVAVLTQEPESRV